MKKVKIGDVCTVTSSKRIFQNEYVGNGVSFWRSKEVIQQENGHEISDLLFISEERYQELERFGYPKEGDLLITSVGTIGAVYKVKSDDRFYFKDGNLTWLRDFDETEIDSSFLAYLIRSAYGQGLLQSRLIGSSQKALTISAISEIEIQLPTLSEQLRIVGVLSAYDSLIENNRKQIKLLEEAAQRLYKEWFVDLRFPGHETAPINLETGLPEGWVSQKLYEAVNVIRGVSYTSDTLSTAKGKRLLNLGNLMPYGGFRDGYEKYYLGKFGEHHVLSSGDIVLGLTEQAEGLAGYAARIPSYLKGSLFSADLALLQPLQLSSEYLYASLRYGNISRTLSPFASGAKIKHLKPDHLRGVEIVVADEATVKSFSETARLLLSKQDVCRQAINCLREARDRLLPKLMEACND